MYVIYSYIMYSRIDKKYDFWNLIQEQFKFVTIKCKNMRVISTLVVSFCTHHITYDPFTFVSQFFSRWYSGHGDMAVSNAIGSNVFDILVCLGLPWFMSTAMVHPGSVVKVRSRGIVMIHIKFYKHFNVKLYISSFEKSYSFHFRSTLLHL